MKHFISVFIFFVEISSASAQRLHIGIFGGAAAYNGDLTDKIFPKKVTNGVFGTTLNYELTEQIMLRGGLNYAVVGGADRFSSDSILRLRNLSFETRLFEFNALVEYYLFNLKESRYSPYVFAGLAVYHFNPYASNMQKVFLKPLSTEGQGINGYPDRKPWHLTQPAIPFGGGVKFAISDNLRVGVEMGLRKLFTDYFDDVSKNYIDQTDLLIAKGQLAVDMAFRGDEVSSQVYPMKNAQRGSPKNKDWYYFAGIHLTFRLGNGDGGGFYSNKRKSRNGCPGNPL
jgi:hypothetical protein